MANPRNRIDTALKDALDVEAGDSTRCMESASEIVESLTAKTALPALERILQQAEAAGGAKGARAARRTAETAARQCQVVNKEVARFLSVAAK